jgi:hypothetical protein
MPLLDIWSVLEDPAWITFALTFAVGGLGLFLLLVLYPFGKDN